jgi:hypothetical protein
MKLYLKTDRNNFTLFAVYNHPQARRHRGRGTSLNMPRVSRRPHNKYGIKETKDRQPCVTVCECLQQCFATRGPRTVFIILYQRITYLISENMLQKRRQSLTVRISVGTFHLRPYPRNHGVLLTNIWTDASESQYVELILTRNDQ